MFIILAIYISKVVLSTFEAEELKIKSVRFINVNTY